VCSPGIYSPTDLNEPSHNAPKFMGKPLLDQLIEEGIVVLKNTFLSVEQLQPQLRHVVSSPSLGQIDIEFE